MCEKAGALFTDDDLLLRQVPSAWMDEGTPSSQAFYAWRTIDEDCLSVDRHSLTTPKEAFLLFTTEKPAGFGMDSSGVWALSCSEVRREKLATWNDPVKATSETPENPAHAVVDFAGMADKERKKVGRRLRDCATSRGRLHPAE